MMNKHDLITKYKHQLILKNFSESTNSSYLSCIQLFLSYVSINTPKEVKGDQLRIYFTYCKTQLGYSYSTMKQHLAAIRFLYAEVLNKTVGYPGSVIGERGARILKYVYKSETQSNLHALLFGRA